MELEILKDAVDNLKLLQEPYKLAKSISEILVLYRDKLELTGFSGIEPFLHETVNSNLEYISSIESKMKSLIKTITTTKPPITKIFEYYSLVENAVAKISEIYNIFIQHAINPADEGSYTSSGTTLTRKYISETNELLDQITDMVLILQRELEKTDIVKYLNSLLISKNIQTQTNKLSEVYESYYQDGRGHLVIRLYSFTLHQFLNLLTTIKDGKPTIKYILELVEKLKTQVLLLDKKRPRQTPKNTIQQLLQWHSLIPASPSTSLTELLGILNITSDVPDVINMSKLPKQLLGIAKILSKEKKFGFIVIVKSIPKPTESNFWNLVDKKYLEKMDIFQPSSFGVNEKNIKRSDTIQSIKSSGPVKDTIIFVDETFGENTKNFYYVLETLNGQDFRFLHIPPVFDVGENIFPVPASLLKGLKNVESSPSMRVQAYNDILNEEIAKHLGAPFIKTTMISRQERQKQETKIKNIRTSIVRQASKVFEQMLNSVSNIKTLQKAIAETHKHIMNAISERVAFESLAESAKPPDPITKRYYHSELTVSYLKDLQRLRKNISRIMSSEFQENLNKINRTLKMSSSSRKIGLIKIFEDMLDKTLEKFITRRSNIYQTVQEKSDIVINTFLKK